MKIHKRKRYKKTPIVKISGDQMEFFDILLSILALIIDVFILVSIWAVS